MKSNKGSLKRTNIFGREYSIVKVRGQQMALIAKSEKVELYHNAATDFPWVVAILDDNGNTSLVELNTLENARSLIGCTGTACKDCILKPIIQKIGI